jgi:CBS domain-containing protein
MIASDVMARDVLTIPQSATIEAAVAIMVDRRISGLPVVDEDGLLVGILSEGDLLHRAETATGGRQHSRFVEFLIGPGREAGEYVRTHSRRVGDLMTADVHSVTEATGLDVVVELMEGHHIRRVPVVRDGRVVGMVSRADLVAALGRRLAAQHATGDDGAIEGSLRSELEKHPGLAASNISMVVKDGVVTLDGVIYDQRTRDALRVAAQNIAGVTSVTDRMIWVDPVLGMVVQ